MQRHNVVVVMNQLCFVNSGTKGYGRYVIKLRVNLQSQPDPTSEEFNHLMILFIHNFQSFVKLRKRETKKQEAYKRIHLNSERLY